MQRILSPAELTIAVMALAAMSAASATPAPADLRHTVESVPILTGGTSERGTAGDAVGAGAPAPMIDTARQNRTAWPIEPDDASYALIRWYLDRRLLPPSEAIRVTGLASAFDNALPSPRAGAAFAPLRGNALGLTAEVFPSPARPGYHILHLGLLSTGPSANRADRRGTTFVVVVEASDSADPRIHKALRALAGALGDRDLLGIVTHGPRGPIIVEPTSKGGAIDRAIDALAAGGAPDLIAGLQSGYDLATPRAGDGPGRILLFSDGIGMGPAGEGLFDDLRRQARTGLTLTVVGFPAGSGRRTGYDDSLMARLARAGDGRYAVADSPPAARGLLSWLPDRLDVVARDVTARIELDPETVSRFRFLGDAPRRQAVQRAGDGRSLAAGGRVSALIELQLTGRPGPLGAVRVRYCPAQGAPGGVEAAGAVKQFELTLPHSPESNRQQTGLEASAGLLAWIAATFGEKLDGSYWARDVSYGRLLRSFRLLDAELRTDPRTAELRYLIQQARRLEPRRAGPWQEDPESSLPGNRVAPEARKRDIFDQLRVVE